MQRVKVILITSARATIVGSYISGQLLLWQNNNFNSIVLSK